MRVKSYHLAAKRLCFEFVFSHDYIKCHFTIILSILNRWTVLINQAYNSTYHHFQISHCLNMDCNYWNGEARKTKMDPPVLNIYELAKRAPCSTS